MNRQKENKWSSSILLGFYLIIVSFFILSILWLPKWGELGQKKYIQTVEQSLLDLFAVTNENKLEDALITLRDTYPLEIAVYDQDKMIYQSLPDIPFNKLVDVMPQKSKIYEVQGVLQGMQKKYTVWYSVYQMPLQAYFEPIFMFQVFLIAVTSIILYTLFFLMRRELKKPLEQVKESIGKLNKFELEAIQSGAEDVINQDVEKFALTLNNRIKAVSRNHTELEYALQLERERLANMMDISRGIVHDLKTPVHQILLENDLIIRDVGSLSKDAEIIANHNIAQLDHLMENINQALKMMNTDITEMLAETESFDIIGLYTHIIKMFSAIIHKNKLYIDADIEEEIFVNSNRVTVHLILHNMLSNALKYAEHASDIQLDMYQKKDIAYIEVENMATNKDIQRMKQSEDLFLAELDTTTDEESYVYSTGNGLYLIKELAHLIGGTYQLVVDEEINKVRIIVSIPQNGTRKNS